MKTKHATFAQFRVNYYVSIIALFIGLPLMSWAHAPSQAIDTLSAVKCFVEAPMDIVPFADRNARLDMIDYFNAGSDKETTNKYGGLSRVIAIDDNSISIRATPIISYQIFVLNPGAKNQYIGVIETIPTPIPDSKLTIYDTRWNEIKSISVDPALAVWLNAEGKKNKEVVTDALPFIMASYVYDPATGILTATQNMDQYFAKNEGEKPLSMLNNQISYTWNGKQFRLNK